MTTSVADKTPIPAKVWRRHNDPPGLWFGVALGSASLHLLAFWLIRSANTVGLWFPQQDQSVVPIELIEVAPQTTSTDKPSRQTQQPVPPTSTNQDAEIINSGEQSQPESNSNIAQSPPEVVPQAESTPTPTTEPAPTPEPTSTPTTEPAPTPEPTTEPTLTATTEPEPAPTPTSTVPIGELPWQRREEIELGQGQPLPSNIPPVTPEQVQKSPAVEEQTPRGNEDNPGTSTGDTANSAPEDNSSNLNGETASTPPENGASNPSTETTNTPSAESSPNPSTDTAKIPTEQYTPTPTEAPANTATENNSSNSTTRGAIATLSPVGEAEARQLANDLPEVLIQYEGSSEKTVDSSYLPGDSTIKPAQLLASLVIDKDGNFQQAIVLNIEPASLQTDEGVYQQLVADLFKNEKFTAARNRDGTKPDFSNFFVRITIKPTGH
ncbi:hypothetical protein NOS3756_34100 [Nostoc sp. NIES-3756]|uniref:hypothetical protein n=1 Tax=Nostoc sp. NIES-3756 TaxID=1751286 RepID=UPI00071F0EDF|nr:hypothetical protein [Nostoc sp. NIES-3756]BAT54440.1 hypothetical protein NOS3756_34100 [Nostoc sp. NIES-3756]